MRLPDFLVIGAAKSGTVSVYHYLELHPDIFMCPVNESNFFALETADLTKEYLGPVDRFYLDQHCVKTLTAYCSLFRDARPHQVVGESSPLYLFSRTAPARIHHHIPTAKIIAILRQPADRAFSNYQHFRRAGIEPIADFEEAIHAELVRRQQGWGPWPFWFYSEMGFFAAQLQAYFDLFGPRQILVVLFEDLLADTAGLMKKIYEFVGVNGTYAPDLSTRHNVGGVPRREWLDKFITKPYLAKTMLKKLLPDGPRRRLRVRLSDWNNDKPRLDPDLRTELTRMYQEDVLCLQQMIGRDLGHWL